MPSWFKALTGLLSVSSIAFGLWALFAPADVAGWIGFTLRDGAASGEVRAVYGGLIIALGVVMGLALRDRNGGHWLRAIGACFLGLALGRIGSLALDGPTVWNAVAGLFEGGTAALFLIFSPKADRAG